MLITTSTDSSSLELNTIDTKALYTPQGLVAEYFVFRFKEQSFKASKH